VKFLRSQPAFILALVLLWRVLLLVFTVQPIPANDAFGYDGAVVNFLHGGRYCNPGFALILPISGRELYVTYPPLYQGVLLGWMKLFGTTVVSSMALHLALFAGAGFLTLAILKKYFPAAAGAGLVVLLLFGFTFGDRPESLAYIFGLGALWLVLRQITETAFQPLPALALLGMLWLTLYTSAIVGAYFFGVGFLACAAACRWRRNWLWFTPFIGAAVLFAVVTVWIARFEPLWWAGFMESARQQSVMATGLHPPSVTDLVKLIRTAPVFLLGAAALPFIVARRREIFSQPSAWLALSVGIFAMGWVILAVSVTLLAANYVNYVGFTQILLGAALLVLAQKYFPAREKLLRAGLVLAVLLVSVRAIGLTTWGAACAWKNSYQATEADLRTELAPYVNSDRPVLISSAFLYQAVDMGVKNPIHSDWYFDHAAWTNNAQINGLIRWQPPRLVLTQFDYYRGFEAPLEQLRQRPDLVAIRVRDLARVRSPDAIPAMRRIVQHLSWAPVIVDLDWKSPPGS
jgi:hypothetical protein